MKQRTPKALLRRMRADLQEILEICPGLDEIEDAVLATGACLDRLSEALQERTRDRE